MQLRESERDPATCKVLLVPVPVPEIHSPLKDRFPLEPVTDPTLTTFRANSLEVESKVTKIGPGEVAGEFHPSKV